MPHGLPGRDSRISTTPGGSLSVSHPGGGDDIAPASDDAAATGRRGAAIAAAFLVHAAALALILLKLPADHPQVEDKPIPVEIVRETPPPPPKQAKAEPQPQAESRLPTEPQPQERPRESGGDTDKAPGSTAETMPAKPLPMPEPRPTPPPRPQPPKVKRPAPMPDLALSTEPSATSIPFTPPPTPPKSAPPVVLEPPSNEALAKALEMGPERGEGGGDRYLNWVRDAVLSHFVFPPEARLKQLAGRAEYEVVVDRQGNLLALHLLQSAGSAILDQAGLDTIRRAAPFGPVPADVTGAQVGLIFTLYMNPLSAPPE